MTPSLKGNKTADIAVIGGGVMGCSVAYNLAKQGARNIFLVERSALAAGGTGKSCAILRTHYSIHANMIHAVGSLKIYENFHEIVGGDAAFRRTGYVVLGPEEHREDMRRVFRMQREYGVDTAELTPEEARELHPLLRADDVPVIGYDSLGGYCDPHSTTTSYAQRAQDLGVTLYTDSPVIGLQSNPQTYDVQTPEGTLESSKVVLAAGPWTNQLGQMVSVEFPYVVSRHKVVTLEGGRPCEADWPVIKDLTTPDKIYCRPETGGLLLVGTGDHGDPVEIGDANELTDHIDENHITRVDKLMARRLPAFEGAHCVRGWTGLYDITQDWNPIVGAVPGRENLYVAVGFSGHGFKLAPTLGEALAQTILGLEPSNPIDVYSMTRFQKGELLQGVYGIGSIS